MIQQKRTKMVNNNPNAEHLRTDECKNDKESEVNKTSNLDDNLLLTSRQSCNALPKFNDTLTGLCSKPPHNNGTVIRPSIEEHSTYVKTTTNKPSYQHEEHSKESNLQEHCTGVIKAIDFTKIKLLFLE